MKTDSLFEKKNQIKEVERIEIVFDGEIVVHQFVQPNSGFWRIVLRTIVIIGNNFNDIIIIVAVVVVISSYRKKKLAYTKEKTEYVLCFCDIITD